MADFIEVEVTGIERVLDKLQRAAKIAGTKTVLEGIGDIVVDSVQENFREEGVDGKKWIENRHDTIAKKHLNGKKNNYRKNRRLTKTGQRRVGKNQILTDTSTLRRSVHRTKFSGDSVFVGTNMPYGAIHHFGGPTGRGKKVNMPARPWLVVNKNGLKRIEEFVESKIEEALK